MKTLAFPAAILTVAAVLVFVLFTLQHRRLSSVAAEEAALRASLEARAAADPATAVAPTPAAPAPLSPDEKVELMQLRNRVSTLREQQRALANVTNERAQLGRKLATLENVSRGVFPPGFQRRDTAQFLGSATPEATLQSFLWSIEHRDTNQLMSLVTPPSAARLAQQFEEIGADAFFKQMRLLPGIRIVEREEQGPDELRLRLEFIPGETQTQSMSLRRTNGAWQLDL